jgi:hypothetical protein
LVVWIAPFLAAGQLRDRPVAARGAEAKTLVLFGHTRSAYSLGNDLALLELQLQRVAARLETRPFSEASSNQLAEADYIVVFCPQPDLLFPTNALLSLASLDKPLLWVGYGAEQLTNWPSIAGQVEWEPGLSRLFDRVEYRGQEWDVPGAQWIPLRLTTSSTARAIMELPREGGEAPRPVCWAVGRVTVYSAVPAPNPLSFLFADALLDFYGATNLPEARLFLRIDDYQAQSNHREFKRAIDYLHSRRHPFFLSVTPEWKNPLTGSLEDLDSAPEFVEGLRYAQQRGGRLLLNGCVRDASGRGEFWDIDLDRPPESTQAAGLRARLDRAIHLLLKHDLLPLAWHTPQDAATRDVLRELSAVFSTSVDRPQLSDATHLEKGLIAGLTLDAYGRQIVPENLGYVSGVATNGLAELRGRAEFLRRLRGSVSGCFIHAWQPYEKWTGLVETLEALRMPFLDGATLDNWVHIPGRLLLTGEAQRDVKVGPGPIRWKAYDLSGKLLAEETVPAGASHEHTFKRKGQGACELFEFTETIP